MSKMQSCIAQTLACLWSLFWGHRQIPADWVKAYGLGKTSKKNSRFLPRHVKCHVSRVICNSFSFLQNCVATGWYKKTVLWKRLNGTYKKFILEFILGGLNINHYYTFGQKLWPLKQTGIFCEKQWKVPFYTECKKYIIVHHPAYFLWAPAEKLRQHSRISFKSWLNNVGSKLHFFYGGLQKLVFRLFELLLNLEQRF